MPNELVDRFVIHDEHLGICRNWLTVWLYQYEPVNHISFQRNNNSFKWLVFARNTHTQKKNTEVEYMHTQTISRANTNSSILNYTYIYALKPSYSYIGLYILFSQHLNTFKSFKCYWVRYINHRFSNYKIHSIERVSCDYKITLVYTWEFG